MEQQKDKIEYPHEIKDVDPDTAQHLMSYFTGEYTGFVRVGKCGYILPAKYKEDAQDIFNMEVRPDDVWVTSFPRSGTTITKELVWLLANELDYETAAKKSMFERFLWFEHKLSVDDEVMRRIFKEHEDNENHPKVLEVQSNTPTTKALEDMKTRRFIATHVPLSLLPPTLLNARVLYVARDPRDVVVSFYHCNRLLKFHGYVGDFKTFWNFFRTDQVRWSPYFSHVKEFWARRNDPNLLFLFYENLIQDRPGQLRRVAEFLGKSYNDDEINILSEHLNIENFRKNQGVNPELSREVIFLTPGEQPFIRKGRSGGWRDYFDEEMTLEVEAWIRENLKDTDLKFPSIP